MAKPTIHSPLRRHFKIRFFLLRKKKLNEVVATDIYFSSVRSIEGYWCAQVFCDCTSMRLKVYGMKRESEVVVVYQDL